MADMDWGDDNNDAGWNDDAGWGDAGCGDDGWGDTNDASSDWGKGGDAWEPVIADSDAPKATLYNVFDRKGANDRRIEIIQAKADDQELPADEVDLLLRYIG